MTTKTNFSTQPYKGTRDFYPELLQKRNYIFQTWRQALSKWSYKEYETSLLENAEIYIAKSGQELGGSQLYNFYDKGERFVALRPEQTPSLARLVANKFGELKFPLRWFSIPNCFRYEQPQKGRLREHWQLNVDVIGLEAGPVDLEILVLIGHLFKTFGAKREQFKILFNHRQLLDSWLQKQNLFTHKDLIYKVLDDWFKLSIAENQVKLAVSLNTSEIQIVTDLTAKQGEAWSLYLKLAQEFPEIQLILDNISLIHPDLEYELNPCIIRGIAYYTGLVYEAFDKNPANSRALFGGGRYDNLMDLFGQNSPAIGFGWGDVTMHEFLEYWKLYPDFESMMGVVGLMLGSDANLAELYEVIIPKLQKENRQFEIDYDYNRAETKRWTSLKKKSCQEIIKIGVE